MSYLFASIEALVIEARQLGFVSEFGANTRVSPVVDSFDPESDGQPALNMTSSGLFGNPKGRHAPVNSNKHRP